MPPNAQSETTTTDDPLPLEETPIEVSIQETEIADSPTDLPSPTLFLCHRNKVFLGESLGRMNSLEKSASFDLSNGAVLSKKVAAAHTAGASFFFFYDRLRGCLGITPRMSNAFARKHGLNPKDGPQVNYQKLSGRHSVDSNVAYTQKVR